MKFPIIQILTIAVPADERMTEDDLLQDVNVAAASDYIADTATAAERKRFIEERLPEILDGVAIVNKQKGTITVRPKEEIVKAINTDLGVKLEFWNEKLKKGTLSYDDPRFDGERYRKSNAMFVFNGGTAMFSGPFVEDLTYYAGKTLYVGGIVFAHR